MNLKDDQPPASSSSIDNQELKSAVLFTLAYGAVFRHPITVAELCRFIPVPTPPAAVLARALEDLANQGVRRSGSYWTLDRDNESLHLRERRVSQSRLRWPTAIRAARLVGRLPFVQAVAVTGSQAANNADADSDIDLMIIAAPGRLWTARFFCKLLSRVARFDNCRVCPNYFVSSQALELPESQHNYYVAREIDQMKPATGAALVAEFRKANGWYRSFLPNAEPDGPPVTPARPSRRNQKRSAVSERVLFHIQFNLAARYVRRIYGVGSDALLAAFLPDQQISILGGYLQFIYTALTERLINAQNDQSWRDLFDKLLPANQIHAPEQEDREFRAWFQDTYVG